MKNKLTIDGVWKHRTGEKTPIEFSNMSSTLKSTYVFNIELIPEEERSTYEKVILKQYYREKSFNKQESVQVCESVPVEVKLTPTQNVHIQIPTIDELVQIGEESVKDYLNLYFKFQYDDWETNVRFNTVDKFISNTSNFMELDEITIAHIKAYKKFKTNVK
jgi:hypothetical protein